MKPVLSPIQLNEKSANVAGLQAALAVLGFQINADEVKNQQVGQSTLVTVRRLQEENKLKIPEGILVDQPTADIINKLLQQKGQLDPTNPNPTNPNPTNPNPGGGANGGTIPATYSVSGTVFNSLGEGLASITVFAFDVDLRGARVYRTAKTLEELKANGGMQPLGTAITGANGNYSISFTSDQFSAAELGLADVVVYAVQNEVLILAMSRLTTDADYVGGTTITNLNITIANSTTRGISEYTLLLAAANNFLKISGLQLSDIFGSSDQQIFLASEIQANPQNVQLLVQAAQLAQPDANYPAAQSLLYGLGREKIPLTNDSIATTDENTILAAWKQAIADNIIDPVDDPTQQSFLSFLHEYTTSQTISNPGNDASAVLIKSIGISTTDANLQTAFLAASRTFTGNPAAFWNDYLPKQPAFANQPQLIQSLQLTNQLSALTNNNLPLMQALQTANKIQSPADLLSFSDDDWNGLLNTSGVPDTIPGATPADKITNYKAQLQTVLNAAFPTQKIAAMVSGDQIKFNDDAIKTGLGNFFSQAKNFDISSSRIADFSQQLGGVAGNNPQGLTDSLGQLQRLFSISPTPDALSALVTAGYQSAYQVANIPRSAFIDMHATDLGGADIASSVHERAAFQALRMQKISVVSSELINGVTPGSIMMDQSSNDVQSVITQYIPNYTTLFGSPDSCACSECRSVYGAAAYLVDLLQFLANLAKNDQSVSPRDILLLRRPDIAYILLTCENTNTLIPYIDLVNEMMEYYVVNGLLDPAVAYDTGDTTTDELHANPQNTLQAAYAKLKDAVYPFSLPYHQALDTERIYFGQMNTTRSEIMTTFRNDSSAQMTAAIDAESMLLSPEAYIIITGNDFSGAAAGKNVWDYYNYPDEPTLQSSIWKVPEFLSRTGLLYTELVNLIDTQFINPGQMVLDYIENLFSTSTLSSQDIYNKLKTIFGGAAPSADPDILTVITAASISSDDFASWTTTNFPTFQSIVTLYEPTSSCDVGATELRTLQSIYENQAASGIPTTLYGRIHRFIRLWRITGYDIFDLDGLISALGEPDTTTTLVSKLAVIKTLAPQLSIPLNKLAVIWGAIGIFGDQSLYIKLFLNKASQRIDPVFLADKWGNYLSSASPGLISDHLPAILAAYRLTAEDFNSIIADSGLNLTTAPLTIANLSILYRYVVLSKSLTLSTADLISIKTMFALNPFSDPASTFNFVTLCNNIQTSGFSVAQLSYIIANQSNPRLGFGLTDSQTQATLLAIRAGFLSIEHDHPDSDLLNVTEDLVRAKMQLLYQPDIIERFLGILNNTAVFFTTTDKNLTISIPAPQNGYIVYIKGSGRLQSTGVLSDDDKGILAALAGGSGNYILSLTDLYTQPEKFISDNFSDLLGASMADALKNLVNHPKQVSVLSYAQRLNWFYTLFLPYLKNRLQENLLVQNVANIISLDEPSTQVLISTELDPLVGILAKTGLTATYFNDDAFGTVGETRTDNTIDFDWGTTGPDTIVPPAKFSARWEGLLSPPASAEYTLVVEVDEADDAFQLFVGGQLVLQKVTGNLLLSYEDVITLNMGTLYPVTLQYVQESNISGVHLYWKTSTSPKQIIATENLFPENEYTEFEGWLNKYLRASVFISGFSLRPAELSHMIIQQVNFDNIDFTNLTAVHWNRVFAYTTLRKSIPPSTTTLIDVFNQADLLNPVPIIDDLINTIVAATGWNQASLTYLVKTQFNFGINDFRNEKALTQLGKAIRLIAKTGAAVDLLCGWSALATDFNTLYDQAQSIKNTVKAQFEDDLWLQVAKKLSNQLRENQKQALIAYLLVQPALIQWGVTDADSLFDYFLIDVQMDSCMDTSRIVQANAAIQLFVSRCQLGEESHPDGTGKETGVSATQIDADQWSWMQYYRVWEANRQVFLYPENWLDPELRDDKSPFFTELESELLQNDITTDTVETALYNYLDKLDQVAHLEICGMYQQNDQQGNLQTLHVFGRTHARPHVYFYRTCDRFWHWSAWEKLPVDVKGVDGQSNSIAGSLLSSGVHLTPVVWKDRLFIFWPEFTKKQDDTISNNNSTFNDIGTKTKVSQNKPTSYYEVSVGWSELRNGKWLPKTVSKEYFRPGTAFFYLFENLGNFQITGGLQALANSTLETIVLNSDFVEDLKEYFLFPSIDGGTNQLSLSLIHNRTESQGYFQFTDIRNPVYTGQSLGINLTTNPSVYDSFFMMLENQNGPLALKGNTYLSRSLDHRILFSPQITDFEQTLNYPFFYQDDRRAYFVRSSDITYWKTVIGTVKDPGYQYYGPLLNAKAANVQYVLPVGPTGPGPIEENFQATALSDMQSTINIQLQKTTNTNLSSRSLKTANTNLSSAGAGSALASSAAVLNTNSAYADYEINNRVSGAFEEIPINGYRIANRYNIPVYDKGLTFYTFYHPYVPAFIQNLNQGGIDLLMESDTNEGNIATPDDGGSLFESYYVPNFTNGFVQKPADFSSVTNPNTYYKENVSFDVYATYSSYNWELFYHVPLYIATRLSRNGKYADAMKWFQYIFDPSSKEPADPANPEGKFWKVLPFKQKISFSLEAYFESLQPGQPDDDISAWRANPFDPFLVARDRPIAFMKNVVMKYIDNLVSWGDDLFRTDTLENINLATELYIIASHILGPRPETIPPRGKIKAETYHSLQPSLDAFSNAMVQLENLFPFSSDLPVNPGPSNGNMLGTSGTLYFCIPGNANLLAYWDTVADRLFKIRHCLNIEGVFAPPALFAPAIDPGLLIRATAAGMSIGSILADMNSPAPFYRFNYLVQKAADFCSEVKSLGNNLQAALEKKDGEDLSRLRASQESSVLQLVTAVKQRQVLEARAGTDNLIANRATQIEKAGYYASLLGLDLSIPGAPQPLSDDDSIDENTSLPGDTAVAPAVTNIDVSLVDTDTNGVKIIPKEKEEMDKSADAHNWTLAASVAEAIAGIAHAFPAMSIDGKPLGVGAGALWGGQNIGFAASAIASVARIASTQYSFEAGKASRIGGFIRREQEWTQQTNMALREIVQTDKQLVASYIRTQITNHELENHRKQLQNAEDMESYLQNLLDGHNKFSTLENYQWLRDQLFAVYKQAYQMAFDMAKKAEKAYQFELGIPDSSFIQYGYFDSSYQGLTAGEQLFSALKQMEKSYIEMNRREFELTKHISIVQNNPDLLVLLQQTGACSFSLPEELFDMDYPGHYYRRLKSVSITIPCVAGPYTTINATLRLQSNSIRINIVNGDSGYPHNNDDGVPTDDSRFIENNIPFVAIATSSAQNDSGVFELNFKDERYLPFEGAGVISTWRLELNGKYLQDDGSILDISQFDYNSIPDIILHLKYTAREDAGSFRQNALKNLQDYIKHAVDTAPEPFTRFFDIRREFPTEWYQFLHPANVTDQQVLQLAILPERFAFFAQKRKINIVSVDLLADSDNAVSNVGLNLSATDFGPLNLAQDNIYGKLVHSKVSGIDKIVATGNPPWKISYPASGPNNTPLTDAAFRDLMLVVRYELD
jgi:Tc toxin complex TcA C-terminal TcB-binding domain/Neuraminidase-like domain/PA14 domain/Salmonella virulence plasmid 28.1kDa A protein